MNYEGLWFGFLPMRLSVVKLPQKNRAEMEDFLKSKVDYVADTKIDNIKVLFQLLHKYSDSEKSILFLNNDHIINGRSNSPYQGLINHISDYEMGETVNFEIDNTTWDPDYDKYKIPRFDSYNGKLIFITELEKDKVISSLINRRYYLSEEVILEWCSIE